jgi:hypothetical protein
MFMERGGVWLALLVVFLVWLFFILGSYTHCELYPEMC